jgi:hypothetical protein
MSRPRVTLCAMSQRDRENGRYGRRVKGALHAHIVIRASGRVPGEEARAARWAHEKVNASTEEPPSEPVTTLRADTY